jgi:hypothetical protein
VNQEDDRGALAGLVVKLHDNDKAIMEYVAPSFF